jgi:hypothetical protein
MGKMSSVFDFDFAVVEPCFVGFQRNHARRGHDRSRPDVERSVVKIALHHVAVDFTFRQ